MGGKNHETLGGTVFFRLQDTLPPPQIWEENGGASYSPNVAYLAHLRGRCGGVGSQEAGAGPHFLLQNFFPIFLL